MQERIFTESDIDELVKKMNQNKWTIKEAASNFYASEATINDYLRRYGYWYQHKTKGWEKTGPCKLRRELHPRKKRFTKEQIAEMVAELNSGMTLKEVGRRHGLHLDVVYHQVRQAGYTFDATRRGDRWRKEPKRKHE